MNLSRIAGRPVSAAAVWARKYSKLRGRRLGLGETDHRTYARDSVCNVVVPAWPVIDGVTARASRAPLQADELRDHPRMIEQVEATRIQER